MKFINNVIFIIWMLCPLGFFYSAVTQNTHDLVIFGFSWLMLSNYIKENS